MINSKNTTGCWKKEQLECFKKYLETFKYNSKKYNIIKQEIIDLENAM